MFGLLVSSPFIGAIAILILAGVVAYAVITKRDAPSRRMASLIRAWRQR